MQKDFNNALYKDAYRNKAAIIYKIYHEKNNNHWTTNMS